LTHQRGALSGNGRRSRDGANQYSQMPFIALAERFTVNNILDRISFEIDPEFVQMIRAAVTDTKNLPELQIRRSCLLPL
jgi:hypothetical protein